VELDAQMRQRNPGSPQRHTLANERKTAKRIEQYHGKLALVATWEQASDTIQIREHDYIIQLKRNVRQIKNYILNRADPNADLLK